MTAEEPAAIPGTKRTRSARATARRDEIARVAQELFARNGFDGTSIRDITDAAGLTKPALYYHFADKEALYEHVLVQRMTSLIASVKAAVDAKDDPIDKIRAYLMEHAGRIDRDRNSWMMSRQSFLAIADPDRRRRVTELRDEFEKLLRGLIEDAIKADRLERKADPALVARMLLSSVNDVPRWLKPGGGLQVQDVASTYVDVTLRGLGADI